MSVNDKNENTPNENSRNENQPLRESNSPLPDNKETDLPDLDGDGFIGNTGGFYGGTSYVGSNYGPDWNNPNSNQGNFGAAGQKDDSDDTNTANKENNKE